MGELTNFNTISVLPSIEYNTSESNNNSENYANPFSWEGNNGVRESTPRALRHFAFDFGMVGPDATNLKSISEYEDIVKRNPGMELGEQLWKKEVYYKYMAPVFDSQYINSSILTALCDVSTTSQNIKQLEYHEERCVTTRAVPGTQREPGPLSSFERVVTTGTACSFVHSYKLDTLLRNNIGPQNIKRHRIRVLSQQAMSMLACVYEVSSFCEQRMMAHAPMDYAAVYHMRNVGASTTKIDELYKLQLDSFAAGIHGEEGPIKCHEWSESVSKATYTRFNAISLDRLPICYGSKENAIVVSDQNQFKIKKRSLNPGDYEIESRPSKKVAIGNDPQTVVGVKTNKKSTIGKNDANYLTLNTFNTPDGLSFIENPTRGSMYKFHIEDNTANSVSALQIYVAMSIVGGKDIKFKAFNDLIAGTVNKDAEETVTNKIVTHIHPHHEPCAIRSEKEDNGNGTPTLKKCAEIKLFKNERTGQIFQTAIRTNGDTEEATFNLQAAYVPCRRSGERAKIYSMLITPVRVPEVITGEVDGKLKSTMEVYKPSFAVHALSEMTPTPNSAQLSEDLGATSGGVGFPAWPTGDDLGYLFDYRIDLLKNISNNQRMMGSAFLTQATAEKYVNNYRYLTPDKYCSNIFAYVDLNKYHTKTDKTEFLQFLIKGDIPDSLNYFFFQFKELVANAIFGSFTTVEKDGDNKIIDRFEPVNDGDCDEPVKEMNEYFFQCMNDDAVYKNISKRAKGEDQVNISKEEAAHLMYAGGFFYQFLSQHAKDFDRIREVKLVQHYTPKNIKTKETNLGSDLQTVLEKQVKLIEKVAATINRYPITTPSLAQPEFKYPTINITESSLNGRDYVISPVVTPGLEPFSYILTDGGELETLKKVELDYQTGKVTILNDPVLSVGALATGVTFKEYEIEITGLGINNSVATKTHKIIINVTPP